MRDQKFLHKKYAWILISRAREILKDLPSLVDLEIPKYYFIIIINVNIQRGEEITVCGDIHG